MFDRLLSNVRSPLVAENRDDHRLLDYLPYISQVEDDVIMLRGGDVMGSLLVEGIGAFTAEERRIDDLAASMSAALAQLGPDVSVWVHRVSGAAHTGLSRIDPSSGFAEAVDERWHAHLNTCGLRQRATMITVTVRPLVLSRVTSLFTTQKTGGPRERRAQMVLRLNEILSHFSDALMSARPSRLTLSSGRWLGLLGALLSGRIFPIAPGSAFLPLSDLIIRSRTDFKNDTFYVIGPYADETRFGAVFSLKSYPGETDNGVFDGFDLPFDTVLTNSFVPVSLVSALDMVRRTVRQMDVAEDAAVSLADQLREAADDIASSRKSLGLHHATITVFADSLSGLDTAASLVSSFGQKANCAMVREDFGARTAYFAQHPGNYDMRARAAAVTSTSFAHFASLHSTPPGLPAGQSVWGDALTVFPTLTGEPYRVNIHLPGDAKDAEDYPRGHTVVIGPTGGGKTITSAFLMTQLMRLSPRIIVFDKDLGMEMPVRAMGGNYSAIRLGIPTGFNPFRTESDERGSAWLEDWLKGLLAGTRPLDPDQEMALSQAIRDNRNAPDNLKTLFHFRRALRSTPDGKDLFNRLNRWDADGELGWLFNGEGADEMSFSNQITAFDLTEIIDIPEVRTAWLSYVFRRIERTVGDRYPTVLLLDEAWNLLDDPYFAKRLKNWMLTMRKMNVAVIMLTQNYGHITGSEISSTIINSLATLIMIPSSATDPSELAPFNLSDGEVAFLTSDTAGRRLALIKSQSGSVIVDLDLKALGPLLRVLNGRDGKFAAPGWRNNSNFWNDEGLWK